MASKIHIGRNGQGSQPYCNHKTSSTSGMSVALAEFAGLDKSWQCGFCLRKLPKLLSIRQRAEEKKAA